MKLVSWNCNMAFRKKYPLMLRGKPDLMIIQECENPDKHPDHSYKVMAENYIWVGKNQDKGVGIFAFNSYEMRIHDSYSDEFEYIIPIEVKAEKPYLLFAVWAMHHQSSKLKSYVGQIWRAVNHYQSLFNERSILIGDFNSNVLWDEERKIGNHTDLVQFLEHKNIFSIYHLKKNVKHGSESQPTFFLYKHRDKPYHLDYCFSSKSIIHKNTSIEIGAYSSWVEKSDHLPLIIDNLG